MNVETHSIAVETQGNNQVIDVTPRVRDCLKRGAVRDGIVTVFVLGSTAGITTTEAEPGLVTHDLKAMFERIAPEDDDYLHERTWHDDNGHSHCRASLLGPGLTVPLVKGELALGTWQQVVLVDFDTRPRSREITVQVIGQ